LRDLLDLSARLLKRGGRLVYFLPAAPEVYRDDEVPRHPALALVANSEQVLSSRYSRRLITMQKVGHLPCMMFG
jgi:tRNA (guanine10-N2)-methyltransferase